MKNKLIGMNFPVEVVQTVLLTGQLSDENPVSLLIIASPESGKTTAAGLAVSAEHGEELAVALTDTTGKGLLKLVGAYPKATHIIFNDLSITGGHKSHVTQYLFGIIGALIEEGISLTADPEGIHHMKAVRGVIGCITPRLVRDQRFSWNRAGLTTRMLPFSYCHGFDLQIRVRRYHAGLLSTSASASDDSDNHSSSLGIPKERIKVSVPRKYRKKILEIAEAVARKLCKEASSKYDYEEHGYRRVKQFLRFAKAHSLLSNPGEEEPRVHKVDVEFLRKLSKFVSYRKPEELEEN